MERWRYLDELDFDSAWVADHFLNPFFLSALAARTDRIRLGTIVTNISMHNPAVLAKQALTVDHVSDGRLELGIGAGGAETDHTMRETLIGTRSNLPHACESTSRSWIGCCKTR